MLQAIDTLWKDHLLAMDHLKEGIGLRGYGQKNPLQEYQREGFDMFQDLMNRLDADIVEKLYTVQLAREEDVERMEQKQQQRQAKVTMTHGSDAGGGARRRAVKRDAAEGRHATIRASVGPGKNTRNAAAPRTERDVGLAPVKLVKLPVHETPIVGARVSVRGRGVWDQGVGEAGSRVDRVGRAGGRGRRGDAESREGGAGAARDAAARDADGRRRCSSTAATPTPARERRACRSRAPPAGRSPTALGIAEAAVLPCSTGKIGDRAAGGADAARDRRGARGARRRRVLARGARDHDDRRVSEGGASRRVRVGGTHGHARRHGEGRRHDRARHGDAAGGDRDRRRGSRRRCCARARRAAVATSFNAISVDGDCSTNDTVADARERRRRKRALRGRERRRPSRSRRRSPT